MPKRIIVTHICQHDGPKLHPQVDKYWDTTPGSLTRTCFCRASQPTQMTFTIEVKEDDQPR